MVHFSGIFLVASLLVFFGEELCLGLQREIHLTKNLDVHTPDPRNVSSIQVSGCGFTCTGEECQMLDSSSQDSFCHALFKMYGDVLYYYQDPTPEASLSDCTSGPHGTTMDDGPFNEKLLYKQYGVLTAARIWNNHGKTVTVGVQFQYGDVFWGPIHGDVVMANDHRELMMVNTDNERISDILGTSSDYIESLGFLTSAGDKYGPYGIGRDGYIPDPHPTRQLLYAEIYLNTLGNVGSISFIFSCP